jgi:hypothetical protein
LMCSKPVLLLLLVGTTIIAFALRKKLIQKMKQEYNIKI